MTTTFADYVAQQDARNDIQLKVREYCLMLCEALEQDFESGRKYYKLIMETDCGSRSVHAFVNMKTGELHKAASFKAPVKEPRFDLRVIKEREWVFEKCDWSGGYLYKNAYYAD